MIEQIVANVELHIAGDADQNPAHPVLEKAFDQADADQQTGEPGDGLHGPPLRQPVDRGADHQREQRRRDVFQHQRR